MNKTSILALEAALKKEKEARIKAEKLLQIKRAEIDVVNKNLASIIERKGLDFKNLFEKIVDNYILTDLYGNVLKMNKAAINFTGFNPEKEGVNVVDIILKEDFKYALSSFFSFLNEENAENYHLRIYTKDKEVKWVEFKPNLILDKNGKAEFAQGIFRDITKQKMEEDAFKKQKQQLDGIVNYSSLGIVLTNEKAEIIKSNSAFQNLIGYTEKELLLKNVKDISFKEDQELTYNSISKLMTGEIENFSINKRYITKSGKIIWAKTNVKGVKNNNGKVMQQVAIIEDITKEIQQGKELDLLLKDLTKSNKELKDFAHVVSHDLKAPLRNMNTLVTWLEEESDDFTLKNNPNFKLLHKNIDKMDLLINGILNYTAVDKIKNKNKNINLNSLLRDILDITYVPKHISINVDSKLPSFKGDFFRMQQLFQNLINNAIKYTNKEKGTINISCKSKDKFWEFSIQDNGIGISKKYFEKIFEIFQSLEEKEGASGIGLSIVKKIITFYDGKIWLTSEINIGTTFYFTLPK